MSAAIHQSTHAGFEIVPAHFEDVPVLLTMIRELAVFEGLAHELEVTAESLHDALFGDKAVGGAVIARCCGAVAGYAIYYHTFSSFVGRPGLWLEDIFVRPSFRQQGIGKALFRDVAALAETRHCGRLEWSVLRWNEKALRFYEGFGARLMDEWILVRMTPGQGLSLHD